MPGSSSSLADSETARAVERFVFIDVVSFDWNCQQQITPRYTMEEIEALIAPLKQRITELEAKAAPSP